ncbi:protein broad-minded-like [Oratosquilla oratoria]|uniref:protein broad-minded-like n=1 Tax=Oratosquilla oratoria TaxID=337810 RepID=UPI003F7581BA
MAERKIMAKQNSRSATGNKKKNEEEKIQPQVGAKAHIKDLLSHLDPMIYLAGTADNTEEMLQFLADVDPAFHKLEIVKTLRTELREKMGHIVDHHVNEYLEENKGKMRSDNPMDCIVNSVETSDDFKDFVFDIQNSISSSVSDISTHFEDEIITGMFAGEDEEFFLNISPGESSESSLNSSLNQSGFLYLHPAQYSNIAETLKSRKEPEACRDALNILLAVTPGEPVMQDCWQDIRKGLLDCLLDNHSEIFDKSLKVHSKLLTSQVNVAVKEAYVNLLECVAAYFMSKRFVSRLSRKQVPLDLNLCEQPLRILQILLDFQKEIPQLWIRYPEKFVDDMVEGTFEMLCLNLKIEERKHLLILDLVCLLDPKALWFNRWIHGLWSQIKTFGAMSTHPVFLQYSVNYSLSYLENWSAEDSKQQPNTVSHKSLQDCKFSHCIRVVLLSLRFYNGRKLFPINIPSKDELLTLQVFLTLLENSISDKTPQHMTVEVYSQLKKFTSQDNMCVSIMCESGVVDLLLQRLQNLDQVICDEKEAEDKYLLINSKAWLIDSILSLLREVVDKQTGKKFILLGRRRKSSSKSELSLNPNSPAQSLLDFIQTLITVKDLSDSLLEKCIGILCSLLNSPLGCHVCLDHPLILHMTVQIREKMCSQPQESTCRKVNSCSTLDMFRAVLYTLLQSYKGLHLLLREGILQPVLDVLLPALASNGQVTTRLLSFICGTQEGCHILGKLKILKPFWDILECVAVSEEHVRPPMSEDEKEKALYSALAPLAALTTTHMGVKLLFGDIGLKTKIEMCLFKRPTIACTDNLYLMTLQLLASAVANPSMLVHLEKTLSYQKKLLLQQSEQNVDVNGAIIVDQPSLIRNHILIKSYLLGGSGERVLPPLFIENIPQYNSAPLFSSYPPPKEYIPEKPIRSMHKRQNDVWRFLSDTRHGLQDHSWLSHCRKAFKSALSGGEEIKGWLVMDVIDRVARSLCLSSDELVPSATSHSTSSSPSKVPALPLEELEDLKHLDADHLHAVQLMARYGNRLGLVVHNTLVSETMKELLQYVQTHIHQQQVKNCDWFSLVLFLVFSGNSERCRTVLLNISKVQSGGVMWVALAQSMQQTHDLQYGEILQAGILHNLQLILSTEVPAVYMACQRFGGCVWNLLGEWVSCVFVGVLPWTEICHYVILVLLFGADYLVYYLVALLRHLEPIITKHSYSPTCVPQLQTSNIEDWHLGDHLGFLEALARRHRRNVLADLVTPLHNLKFGYTPRQL